MCKVIGKIEIPECYNSDHSRNTVQCTSCGCVLDASYGDPRHELISYSSYYRNGPKKDMLCDFCYDGYIDEFYDDEADY